jgi:UDP-N-acetylmuramoylalanine--D-glutamate ligase
VIPVPDFAGRAVALLGLDPRGLAAARALMAGGAQVMAWDERADARAQAAALGVETPDLRERDWGDLAALVVSPECVATTSKASGRAVLELAALTRTPILADVELFARARSARPERSQGRVVAITGARGKSTTAALIGHILKSAGRDPLVSGGAGAPVLDLAPPHPGAIYVLELGAADVDLSPSLRPKIAVLLNAEESHERGADPDGDANALARIFTRQTSADHAVIGVDDAHGRAVATEIRARDGGPAPTPVSASRALGRGVHAVGGVLFDAVDGRAHEALDLRSARALPGRHSWQNAAAAYAVCRLLGLEPSMIAGGIASFPGAPHRLEQVGALGAVRFINDSMASDAGATRQALATFENIYWIAGGRLGGASPAGLAALMPRVAKAYLIEDAAETIAAALKGRVVTALCRDLETAVARAAADAAASKLADPVVLFSPACVAPDRYPDAAVRGNAFRALVEALPGASKAGKAA